MICEFLDQDSLDRFGILYLTTSVGLGVRGAFWSLTPKLSRQPGSPDIGPQAPIIAPRTHAGRICPVHACVPDHEDHLRGRAALLRHSLTYYEIDSTTGQGIPPPKGKPGPGG